MSLVFGVCDMLHVPVPTSATAAALIALLRGRAAPAFIDDRGPVGPGLTGRGVVLCIR